MDTVSTVLGKIKPCEMGHTLSHEHFMMTNNALRYAFPDWLDMQDITEQCVIEANRLLARGIKTVIDATPINLGRDVMLLREIARKTGLNIIASTGLYYQEMPWFKASEFIEEKMASVLLSEVENGMEGTDSRPGIIKCATEAAEPSEVNRKMMRMTALLQKQSGLPIMTHANAIHKNGLYQQEIFAAEGVDLGHVIIGHCDDTNDITYIIDVIKNGSYVGMDRMGVDFINPLANRIVMLEKLIERGYGDRLVLSHDCNVSSDCSRSGGNRFIRRGDDPNWNFRIITDKVLPELRRRGVSEETIEDLTVNNIRRFFEGC